VGPKKVDGKWNAKGRRKGGEARKGKVVKKRGDKGQGREWGK